MRTQRVSQVLKGHKGNIHAVAFSKEGMLVGAANNITPPPTIRSMAWSPPNLGLVWMFPSMRLMLETMLNSVLQYIDRPQVPGTGRFVCGTPGLASACTCVAGTRAGSRLSLSQQTVYCWPARVMMDTVRVWDCVTGKCIKVLEVGKVKATCLYALVLLCRLGRPKCSRSRTPGTIIICFVRFLKPNIQRYLLPIAQITQ